MGPDFLGAGYPFGSRVDAHYFSPAWNTDLRTMVHILPDGETQVYHSMLYEGPTVHSFFNGMYKRAFDYNENAETKTRIDAFVEAEKVNCNRPHVLPQKLSGRWTGTMHVYDEAVVPPVRIGENQVTVEYTPLTLLRNRHTVTISGIVNKTYTFETTRTGCVHSYDGPDVWGNAMGYGRSLHTSQHFAGEALKIKGREFMMDHTTYAMSVVWQFRRCDKSYLTTYGVLNWEPTTLSITAGY